MPFVVSFPFEDHGSSQSSRPPSSSELVAIEVDRLLVKYRVVVGHRGSANAVYTASSEARSSASSQPKLQNVRAGDS
eukprot:16440930-Heterocapsa_arctica.AAC.1